MRNKPGVKILVLAFFLLPVTLISHADIQEKPYRVCVTTYTYKTVADLKIKLDVHQVEDGITNPVVVWIHGGALMVGRRQSVPAWLKEGVLALGCDIVSIDYRLAPETKLAEIIKDLEDAFKWLHGTGAGILDLDMNRVAVMGVSAGGYLSLTAGFRLQPKPTMIASLWGYGDLVGEWLSEPSTHPRHNQATMTAEQAEEINQALPVTNDRDRTGDGWAFYQYCRQRGLWPEMASGFNLQTEKEKYYQYMPLKNVSKDYPPTLLIHGTIDTDVPHLQSELLVEAFKKFQVPHRFFSVKNGEHGLWRADRKEVKKSQDLVLAFVKKYLKD